MYEQFYGFKRKPFQLLPNADFFFRSRKHDIALTYLEYGIYERAGFIVITGEIGTGKTTLLNYLLRTIKKDLPIVYLSQTYLNPEEFLRIICQEFSLPHEGKGKSELIELFGKFLVEQFQKDRYVILILDEAQNLPFETLEEIRMLSNLDAGSENLLQIILVGQPALREKLRWERLRQLSQRIEVSYHLGPLDRDETGAYIRYRIERAEGPDLDIFDDEAIEEIYNYSGGIPRIINAVCHMCLVYGMADELRKIDHSLVKNVLKDRSSWELLPEKKEEVEKEPQMVPPSADITRLEDVLRSMDSKLGLITEIATSFKIGFEETGKKTSKDKKEDVVIDKKQWEPLIYRLTNIDKTISEGMENQNRLIKLLTSSEVNEKKEKGKNYNLIFGGIFAFILVVIIFHLFVIDLHSLWSRLIGSINLF